MGWDSFKQYFTTWESATAKHLEVWMKSPLVLEPAGTWLSMVMKTKAAADRNVAEAWGLIGLPTKRDQERTLHALNQIQSRLLDLEEQLAALAEQRRAEQAQPRAAEQPGQQED